MIDAIDFYNYLKSHDFELFTGVPDSLLKEFCSCVYEHEDSCHNIICANEGNSVALASGYHLSTGKYGVVYMQNSGIGNAVNPLLSLADPKVYSIPMLLIIGWRGEPGVHDEPQHVKQGEVTLTLLETLGIQYFVLKDNYENEIDMLVEAMKKNSKPVAIVVRKGQFSYKKTKPAIGTKYSLTREKSLEVILNQIDKDDYIVTTTGKTSRELFELRETRKEKHSHDFLTVGSMGHTSSIALGIALGTNKNVWCYDGDGSFFMHMGSGAVNSSISLPNYKYIVNNNGAHESVGSQPTVGFFVNMKTILEGCGYKNVYEACTEDDISFSIDKMKNEDSCALIIYTKTGSRDNLGRPSISPIQNKKSFMKEILK